MDKSNVLTPPDSPVGVKEGIKLPTLNDNMPPPDKQAQPVVRINNNPTPPSSHESSTTLGDKTTPSSVLKNPSPAPAEGDNSPTTRTSSLGDPSLRGLEQGNNYVIDRLNRLYISYDKNGQESRFHVKDFVGLFPWWPIIEMSITPTGSTKDKRMTNVV